MKKARIILASVALLSIAGGALAFKAKRDAANVYCTNAAGACITTSYQVQPRQDVFTTTKPCPLHNSYYTLANCPNGGLRTGTVYTQPDL